MTQQSFIFDDITKTSTYYSGRILRIGINLNWGNYNQHV